MGDTLARIKAFPPNTRQDAGFQIDKVQHGETPDNWKPMKIVGKGVNEIRLKDRNGQYRVIYLANLRVEVYILHAFLKKSQQTRKLDIDLARKRLGLIGK